MTLAMILAHNKSTMIVEALALLHPIKEILITEEEAIVGMTTQHLPLIEELNLMIRLPSRDQVMAEVVAVPAVINHTIIKDQKLGVPTKQQLLHILHHLIHLTMAVITANRAKFRLLSL